MSIFTILCVDDERNVLLTLRDQLSRHFPEFAIEIAESGTEALELIEELLAEGAEIPLVIVDQIMPGMKGDELLIQLHARHPQILQVMLTGQARAEDVGNVVNRGNLYRFISKPWDEIDLCLTITEALRRYHHERQLAEQQSVLEQANQELTILNTELEQQVEDRTQQLQAALNFNQQVIATAQEGIIVWDRDLRYRLWNRFMEDMSGIPAAAVLGQFCLDVFPFLQENGIFALVQRALAGEMVQAPDAYFHLPETGKTGWSSECFIPLRDAEGTVTGVLGTVHDITERKRAEAQAATHLAEAMEWQNRYAAAGRASRQLLYDYDVNTQKTVRMGDEADIGYSIAELGSGGHEFWASLIHADDRPLFETSVIQAVTQKQPFQRLEYRLRAKDDSYIWVQDNNTILLDEAGNPSHIIGYVTNITDRKQAEVTLRESEERLRRLTENVPGMVYRYVQHPDGTHSFPYVSLRCLTVYGVDSEAVMQSADALFSTFHPEDRLAVEAAIATSYHDPEQIFFVEHRIITPDGQEKWVQSTMSLPYRQANGDVIWDGVTIDITARKQAELALQSSQQFIQQVADSSPNVIYIYDLALQRNIYVNREVTTFLGYTQEEVAERVDQSLANLMHPDDLEPAMRHFERLATLPDGAIADFEYRMRHKNGEWRWFSSRDTVFKRDESGRVSQLLGNAQDVTRRKLAEEELRANEQKYHQILDAITDIVLVKGPESKTVWANRALRDFYGMSLEELQSVLDAPFNRPDYTQQYVRDDAFVFNTGQTLKIPEEYSTRHDGVVCTFSTIKTPIRNEQGQVIMTVGVARDVTEQRQIEAEIRRSQQQLAAIAANIPGGVFRMIYHADGSHSCPFASAGYRTLFGISPEELQTNPERNLELVHPDDLPIYTEAAARAIAGETTSFQGEVRYILPTGEIKWVATTAQLYRAANGDVIVDGIDIDISERKRAEAALQESERMLSMALAAAKAGVWEWTVNTNTAYWSEENFQLMGYEPGSVEPSFDHWLRAVHPEDRERASAYMAKVLEEQSDLNLEYRVLLPDGSIRWLIDVGRLTFDAYNNPVTMSGIQVDITDRKQAEQALVEIERQQRSILENIPSFITKVDREGRMLFLNRIAPGFSTDEVIGQTLETFTAPESRTIQQAALTEAFTTGQTRTIETEGIGADGTPTIYEVRIAPIPAKAGEIDSAIVVATDITDRKQAEIALRNSEEQLRLTLEFTGIGAWNWYPQTDTYFWNDRMTTLLELPADTDNIYRRWCDRIHPEDLEQVESTMQHALKTGTPWQSEYRYSLQDGRMIWLWGMGQGIYTETGEITKVLGVLQEITDRKNAELELQQLNEDLEQRVQQRTQELVQSEQDLRTIFNNVYDAIYIHNLDGSILNVNDRGLELHSATREQILASTAADLMAVPLDPAELAAFNLRLQTGESFQFESKGRRFADNSTFDTEVSLRLITLENRPVIIACIRDISDRKQAEQALRDSEARFQAFMNNSPTSSWISDARGVIVYVSQTYSQNFQTASTDVIGKSVFECYPPDIAQQFVDNIQQVITTNQILETIEIAPRADGTLGDFLVYKFPILDTSEQGLVGGVAIDITDRKRAEAALREALTTNQALLNAIPDLIMRIGQDGIYRDIIPNPSVPLVAPLEQIVGSSLWDLLPENIAQYRFAEIQQAIQTGRPQVHEYEMQIDGEMNYFEARCVVCGEDEVMVLVRDISDRKRAETELQQKLQMLDTSTDAIIIRSLEGVISYWNQGAERLYGFTSQEAVGQVTHTLFQTIFPSSLEAIMSELLAQSSWEGELTHLTQDGKTITVSSRWTLQQNPQGQPIAILETNNDITARKYAEAQLQEQEQFLRSIFEGTENPLFVIDVLDNNEFRYAGWNLASEKISGICASDVVGKTPVAAMGVEQGSVVFGNYQRCLEAGEMVRYEEELTLPSGTVWTLTTLNPLRNSDGKIYRIVGNALKITDRKQAEAQVKRQEYLLRNMYEGVAHSICIIDVVTQPETGQVEFYFDSWNRATEIKTGILSRDIAGKTPTELLGETQGATVRQNYQRCFDAGTSITYEEFLPFQDQAIWWLTTLNPLKDDQGNIYRIVVTTFDISDRKQAELELQKLAAVVENSGDLIGIASLSGESLYLNAAGQELMGVIPGTLQGMPVSRFLSPEGVIRFEQDALPVLMQQGYWQGETTFRHLQTGEDIVADQTLFLIRDSQTNEPLCMATISRDIRDRKQAEANLIESESRLRHLLSTTSDWIWEVDSSGVYTYVNGQVRDVLGYAPEEVLGKTPFDFMPPAEAARVLKEFLAIAQEQLPFSHLENSNLSKDGQEVVIETTGVPIFDADGNYLGYRGTCSNITERKRAEAQLREQEQFLRSIYEGSSQPIFVVDVLPNHTVRQRSLNPMAERIMGKSSEELIGLPLTEIFAPNDAEEILQRYAQCITAKQPRTFEECITLQGETRWMLSTYNPLLNDEGQVYRVVGTVYDISDRKQAEIALQEAQQFAQSIADRTPAALYIYDLTHQSNIYSNRSIIETMGYTIAEVQAMGANLMPTIIHPDDFPTVIQHQQAIAHAADGEDIELEYRLIHADGSIRWLYSVDSVFKRDKTGQVTQYIGAAQDITDRKRAEHALQQLNLELEQRVSDRTLALQQAMEAAEAANQAKSTFLANMSHELRTPLNAILGFAQLMSRDMTIELEKREQLSIINRSGKHLLHLINDILEMSKIESGRIQLTSTSFDLDILLNTLQDMFQHRATEKRLQFIVDRSPTLPRCIETDESKLRQVLINLIGNAIKFTNSGRVELRVFESTQFLQNFELLNPADCSSNELDLCFEIIDSGIGIAEDELESLFEPFTQSKNRQVFQEGTGLGLSISRQFVQLMGGQLTVISSLNQGSIFTVTIPVQLVDATNLSPSVSPAHVLGLAPNQPTYRILVVEDTETNRILMVQLMQSIGFEVQTAANGQDAIALWETWHPHLIWMDMRMPGVDGYEATRQIRQKESLAESSKQRTDDKGRTIIIALTASAFEQDRARVLEIGCNDFVRKPFQEAELLEKMVEHLGVQYVYAEAEPTELPGMEPSPTLNAIAALRTLPITLLTQLHQATLELNNQQLVVLLDQVATFQPTLATLLREKLENFDLEEILHLLQDAMK